MSEEVNAIINNLCDRLGTSAKLLIPEIAKLRIVESVVMLAIFLVILIIGLYFLPKVWKYDHRIDEDGYQYSCDDSVWFIVPSVITFVGFIGTTIHVFELVGWFASPTTKAILEIIRMVK